MSWKRKFGGGVVGLVGFILSPLSWWNDLFVNVPLALGTAWLVAAIHPPAFEAAAVIAYWLTNVLGFVLMHKGAQQALGKGESRPYSRKDVIRDLGVSLGYTLLIVVLIKLGVLQPVQDYFSRNS